MVLPFFSLRDFVRLTVRHFDSLAGHARFDPGFQSLDELVVRERGQRTARARGPGIEDERIRLHVLNDLFGRATTSVARRIFHLLANLLRAPAFPEHRQRREAPISNAGHEPVRRVRRLVTGLTLLRRRTVAVLPANDERQMDRPGIALPRRLVLMAVDASRVHEDARDGIESRGCLCGWRLDAIAREGEQPYDQ